MTTPQDLVQEAMSHVKAISCETLKEQLAEKEEILVIDVREPMEFEMGHIEGAVNVPRGILEFKIEGVAEDKKQHLIICCAAGSRAALAAETLKELGYKKVEYLDGGYQEFCEKE